MVEKVIIFTFWINFSNLDFESKDAILLIEFLWNPNVAKVFFAITYL